MTKKYLFADTDLAAQRLRVLSAAFAQSSRDFILQAVTGAPRLVLDLGCGPGYTTHLLGDILPNSNIVGLDNSEHFIGLAKKTGRSTLSFHLHDVTTVPFPVGPADLLYCRFLFTHLTELSGVVAKWATQLHPHGLMLMEEVESIHTRNAVFKTYIGIVEALLESQSNMLYVGPVLDRLGDVDGLKRRMSRIAHPQVANDRAATMFFLNLQSWKHHAFIQRNYAPAMINKLEHDLHVLMEKRSPRTEIEWALRQLVYERA